MNTKTTKFLAVLAVIAMAFASFAVLGSEQSDAAADVTAKAGDYEFYAPETAEITVVGNTIYYSGHFSNNDIAGDDVKSVSDIWESTMAYYAAIGIKIKTSNQVMVEQTNNALKDAYKGGIPGTPSWTSPGLKIADGKMTRYYANDTFASGEVLAVLVPQDNSNVTLTITERNTTTGEETSTTYTLVFKDSASTHITLGDNTTPVSADVAKWSYDKDNAKLTLNGCTANISFYYAGNLTVTLKEGTTSTLKASNVQLTSDKYYEYGAIGANGTLTIATETAAKASTLKIIGLGDLSLGLVSSGKMTLGNTSSTSTAAADTIISITDVAQGLYPNGGLDAYCLDLEVSAGERGINANGALDFKFFNNINLGIDGSFTANGFGDEKIFGLRTKSTVATSANTTIITMGWMQEGTTDNEAKEGKIIVEGGYVQTCYSKPAYGIAGYVSSLSSAPEATQITSVSEANEKGTYVIDGAQVMGVTLKNTGGTVIAKDNATTTSETTPEKVIEKIAELVDGCEAATIKLTAGSDVTSLDVSKLLKNATIAALDSLTLVADTVKTLTASDNVDVSGITLKFIGFTDNGVSGTFEGDDGSTLRLAGVKGACIELTDGCVRINGAITSGTAYVSGDAELYGTITGALNILPETGATAAELEILAGTSLSGAAASLSIQGVDVYVDSTIQADNANATLYFKTGSTLDSDVIFTGTGKIKSDVAFTKGLALAGDEITIGSDLYVAGTLYLAAKTVNVGANSIVTENLIIAEGTTVNFVGASATALESLTVTDEAIIVGTLNLTFATATFNGITELSGLITYADDKSVITNNGTMTVTETGITAKTATFTDDSASNLALNFVNNSVLVIKGVVVDLTNNKTVRLYGDIGYTTGVNPIVNHGKLVNEGTVYIMLADAKIVTASTTGTGNIDTSAVSEEVSISGNIITAITTFNEYQIVTFIGNTTLKAGAQIIFKGSAIIPEGVTVTIEDGSSMSMETAFGKLHNDGTIIVQGVNGTTAGLTISAANAVNDGTISADYSGNALTEVISVKANSNFTNNGVITVGEKSRLATATANFVNSATGVITVYGDLTGTDAAAIKNSGSVAIASEVNTEAIKVSNAAAGANVVVYQTAKKITVNDDAFKGTGITKGENVIVVDLADGAAGTTVGGFTITSQTYKYSATVLKATALTISGTFSVDPAPAAVANNVDLKLTNGTYGCIAVTDALALSGVDLSLTSATTELYVSGIMSIDDTCTNANAGEITVVGTLMSTVNLLNGTVNAARYDVPADATLGTKKTYVYTTVPAAVEAAEAAEIKTVTVTGTVDVESNVVVPAGMTLKIENATVNIAEDVEVEIESDGTTTAVLNSTSGTINVYGKLVIDDVSKAKKGTVTIISEVLLKSGVTEVYTTLAWALADIGSEEATLTLCGDTVVKKNTTIPENITVDTNGYGFTVQNVELTIDGTLYIAPGTDYTVTGDNGEIVLNGAIMKDTKMEYTDGKAYPAGLYFSIGDSSMYVIGSIEDAEAWAVLADNDRLVYYGDLETTAINFDVNAILIFEDSVKALSMDAGSGAKITFKDDVAIATATIGACTLTFNEGIAIAGNFVSPVGSILFLDSEAVETSTITVTAADKPVMTLTGTIGIGEAIDDFQVATVGDVTIKATLDELTVGDGTTTIAANCYIGAFKVYGELVVKAGYKMTALAGLVYGSLVAEDATSTVSAASVNLSWIGVGIEYDYTSSAASVAGTVNAILAFVGVGSDVSDSSIADMIYQTEVYVEDDLFLTAYAATSGIEFMDSLENLNISPSDPSAKSLGWFDEDGNDVDEDATVGQYDEIYALFNYNVYDVQIITDAGIKSVAINGIELKNMSGNVFEVPAFLTAGTYKVTYTLKNGYSGTAVLSTSTGTILKDNSFVISPGSDTELSFQLAGTEPTPEPEPVTPEEQSEWTITTILLVILVILIAIMAVIVALRLNRN